MSDLNLKFQLTCKNTQFGENVFLVGNTSPIGNWDTNKSIKLNTDSSKFPLWESNSISFKQKSNLEYKYIIKGHENIKWESFQGNRQLDLTKLKNDEEY